MKCNKTLLLHGLQHIKNKKQKQKTKVKNKRAVCVEIRRKKKKKKKKKKKRFLPVFRTNETMKFQQFSKQWLDSLNHRLVGSRLFVLQTDS